ncbi:hypothetical protein [Candidatus Methylacidithermus pantelleriae]|uniref:Uncharacterized protein n=1 Tax=Candidatus Methylacidithermus pantelleriae TaxID=2744239 RepID=A0A8J2BP82_9BACT|nr:hypothetical protein [Candidatus Methylacidithermus pantelleriae]CAF0698531.1 hypothetical protein MPNT_280016 [Candidatus Methylacidithermus pantelleriae]
MNTLMCRYYIFSYWQPLRISFLVPCSQPKHIPPSGFGFGACRRFIFWGLAEWLANRQPRILARRPAEPDLA